jgi:hypothetical protein
LTLALFNISLDHKNRHKLPEEKICGEIKKMEFSEMQHFASSKKQTMNPKNLNCNTRKAVARILDHHDTVTFRKHDNKIKHLKHYIFYTTNEIHLPKYYLKSNTPPVKHTLTLLNKIIVTHNTILNSLHIEQK